MVENNYINLVANNAISKLYGTLDFDDAYLQPQIRVVREIIILCSYKLDKNDTKTVYEKFNNFIDYILAKEKNENALVFFKLDEESYKNTVVTYNRDYLTNIKCLETILDVYNSKNNNSQQLLFSNFKNDLTTALKSTCGDNKYMIASLYNSAIYNICEDYSYLVINADQLEEREFVK